VTLGASSKADSISLPKAGEMIPMRQIKDGVNFDAAIVLQTSVLAGIVL